MVSVAIRVDVGFNGDMIKLILKSTLLAVTLLATFILSAGSAGAGDANVADGGVDTTPPDPYIRARTRQDLDYVFKHGIQTTCGTADDERPVTCRMSASRKGRVLAVDTQHIVAPYNRFHFNLHISTPEERKIRRAEPPIEFKLRLRATDEAGNHASVTKKIRLVKDLYGD